jgi:hypothetical protein
MALDSFLHHEIKIDHSEQSEELPHLAVALVGVVLPLFAISQGSAFVLAANLSSASIA